MIIFQKMLCWKFEVRHKYLLLCAQAYVHAQRTPLFWMVHSKQVADFTGTFNCKKWQYKWWFFEYFWKIKGMNLQNNGVWRMVHHKLMYERGSWMGLSAWTFFMPSGINNRSCTQSHSWTPKLHVRTTVTFWTLKDGSCQINSLSSSTFVSFAF